MYRDHHWKHTWQSGNWRLPENSRISEGLEWKRTLSVHSNINLLNLEPCVFCLLKPECICLLRKKWTRLGILGSRTYSKQICTLECEKISLLGKLAFGSSGESSLDVYTKVPDCIHDFCPRSLRRWKLLLLLHTSVFHNLQCHPGAVSPGFANRKVVWVINKHNGSSLED